MKLGSFLHQPKIHLFLKQNVKKINGIYRKIIEKYRPYCFFDQILWSFQPLSL